MLFANSPKCPKSSFPTQTLHLGPLFANSPRGHQLQCPAERHGHGHPDHVVPGLGSAERGRSAALGRRDHIQRRASVTDACSHLGRRKILDRFRGQMRSWQVLGEHAGPVKHCFIGVVCVCVCVRGQAFLGMFPPPPTSEARRSVPAGGPRGGKKLWSSYATWTSPSPSEGSGGPRGWVDGLPRHTKSQNDLFGAADPLPCITL